MNVMNVVNTTKKAISVKVLTPYNKSHQKNTLKYVKTC